MSDAGEEDKTDSIVDLAKKRYQRAYDYYKESRLKGIQDTRFVLGDSDNLWQWPEDTYNQRSSVEKRPCLTINVTAQHCNQIINQIRQNRPTGKVIPGDARSTKQAAEVLASLVRNIQAESQADTAHDLAAEHAIYGGEGYWRVVTEYEHEDSFDQIIKIKQIRDVGSVYIDPDCKEADRSDAKWGFVFEDITTTQAKDEHPDLTPTDWVPDGDAGWVQKDTIRRAEYFWCEYKDDTIYQLSDGTVIAKSKLPPGTSVKGKYLIGADIGSIEILKDRATKRKQWYWCKLVGGATEPIDKKEWPGSYLPIITVVGKEISVNGEVVRKGIVRDLKDTGRMVNYSYSAAVETLALQTKTPYVGTAEAIEGHEEDWGNANTENLPVLIYNGFTDDGTPIPPPMRQSSTPMATAQIQMLQVSTEQMRAASGQQNANFGIKSEAQSGIGIQRLKAQGEIATFHFPDNLARSLEYEIKVLVDLIPKVMDTKRVVRLLGIDGKQTSAVLDPDHSEPYTEGQPTEEDVEKIFNPTLGRYGSGIDTGPSYQTQRQESADAMIELAGKAPIIMEKAPDLVVRSLDFPMSDELADRLKPPGIDDQSMPPAAQAQLQQMGQQIQAMSDALENAHTEVQGLELEKKSKEGSIAVDQQKVQIDAKKLEIEERKLAIAEQEAQLDAERVRIEWYDAETKRIEGEAAVVSAAREQEIRAQEIDSAERTAANQASEATKQAQMSAQATMHASEQTAKAGIDGAGKKPPETAAEEKPRKRKMTLSAPSGTVYDADIDGDNITVKARKK